MKKLVLFEFKNLWTQLTIVAVISLIVVSTIFNLIAFINGEQAVTASGNQIAGIPSYREIKKDVGNVAGVINQDYLDKLYSQYNQSIEKQQLEDKIGHYLTKYTFSNYIINFSKYGVDFNNAHMDLEPWITEEEFYAQYKHSMSEVIKSNNRNNWFRYTEEQLKLINEKINEVKTPFSVDYYSGISLFKWQFGKQFWLVLIVMAFALSSLFAKDSSNGITELTLSSKFGRRKNMNSRIVAGNLFTVIIYALFVAVLWLEIGLVASFQGVSQSIQNLWYTCTYNISAGGGMLIMLASGLLTVLIISNLVMLISIIVKSSKASTVLSLLTILFLNSSIFSNNSLQGQLSPIGLATNFSFGIPNAFEIYYFVGNIMIPYTLAFAVIGVLYLIAIRVMALRCYQKYKIN